MCETTKKSGIAGFIKNGVSVIVGAVISFGVTFGVITSEQAETLNTKMTGINTKAEQVVEKLKAGDINAAMIVANEIGMKGSGLTPGSWFQLLYMTKMYEVL